MPQRPVDLHVHSTCSDGTFPPAEVVRQAAERRVAALALCDHDNIDGIDAAQAAGADYGLEVVPGVELSVVWEEFQDIHLLGYGFDHRQPELGEALDGFRRFRANRNREIVERINRRLSRDGKQQLDFARIEAQAGGSVGRPHIGRALLELGHVGSLEEAFQRYLVPCNVPKRYFPMDEAIALVRQAGGVAVLAHPIFMTRDRPTFERLLDCFVALGLKGVEAYHQGVSRSEIDWYIGQARRRRLIVTGGSDFHGDSEAQLGRLQPSRLAIPASCLDELHVALAE